MKLDHLEKQVQEARKRSRGNKNILILEDDKTNEVRLVPNKELGETQFKNIFLHYKQGQITPYTMYSPRTFGEEDIVEAYVKEVLSKGMLPVEEFKMYKNMEPSEAFITTAVIRGKEEEGTKLWILSVAQFEALVTLIKETFVGQKEEDISDPEKGYDVRVKVVSKDKSENNQRKITFVAISRAPSPLTTDEELKSKLLEDQPSWEDAYEYADNEKLQSYISRYESGDDAEDGSENDSFDGSKDVSNEEDEKIKKAMEEMEALDDDDSDGDLDLDSETDSSEQSEKKQKNEAITADVGEEDDDLPF